MRDPKTGKFIKKVNKMKAKREHPKTLQECSKQDLLKRIQECMTRVWGKEPDVVLNWNWDQYKTWITEPFFALVYEEYDDSREI